MTTASEAAVSESASRDTKGLRRPVKYCSFYHHFKLLSHKPQAWPTRVATLSQHLFYELPRPAWSGGGHSEWISRARQHSRGHLDRTTSAREASSTSTPIFGRNAQTPVVCRRLGERVRSTLSDRPYARAGSTRSGRWRKAEDAAGARPEPAPRWPQNHQRQSSPPHRAGGHRTGWLDAFPVPETSAVGSPPNMPISAPILKRGPSLWHPFLCDAAATDHCLHGGNNV
jgi:hypothetical protein